jgi:hypothetical protein
MYVSIRKQAINQHTHHHHHQPQDTFEDPNSGLISGAWRETRQEILNDAVQVRE